MKPQSPASIENLRKRHNLDLIRRMRDGDPLKSFDSKASWYPPRPVIEKDGDALYELYGSRKGKMRAQKISADHDDIGPAAIVAFRGTSARLGEGDESHKDAG